MILLCRGQKTLFTGHTTLFTHLKIILLQCFQFSVFNFSNNKFNPNGPLVGFADPFSFLHRFPSPSSKTKNKIPTISELRTSVRNLLLSHSGLYLQWSKKLNHFFEVRFFSSFFIFLIVSPSASGLKSLSQLKFSVFNFSGPNSTKLVSHFSTFKAFDRRRREEKQWILLWAKENKNKEKMKEMTERYGGHCERKRNWWRMSK